MSAAPSGATRGDLQQVSLKIDTLNAEVSAMKAVSAADTATLRVGQEHLRGDMLERHQQNRKDIHDHNGKLDELNGKLYLFKEELKEDLDKKFTELGDKLSAQVVKSATGDWVIKLGQAVVLAVILALITAAINHTAGAHG